MEQKGNQIFTELHLSLRRFLSRFSFGPPLLCSYVFNKLKTLFLEDTDWLVGDPSPSSLPSETHAEPSLQATQLKLKRARLADDLNEKIAQRPGPMELVEKNILPVDSSLKEAIIGKRPTLNAPARSPAGTKTEEYYTSSFKESIIVKKPNAPPRCPAG